MITAKAQQLICPEFNIDNHDLAFSQLVTPFTFGFYYM